MCVAYYDRILDNKKCYEKLYNAIIQNWFYPNDQKKPYLVVSPNLTFAAMLKSNSSRNYSFTSAKSHLDSSIRDAQSVKAYYVNRSTAINKSHQSILIFAERDDEKEVEALINAWYPAVTEDGALHLYIAKRLLEKRENNPAWSTIKNCHSVVVNVFERTEFAPGSPECCHVVLRKTGNSEAGKTILFRKIIQTEEGVWQNFEAAIVPVQDLEKDPYRQIERMVSGGGYKKKVNAEAVEYQITRELSVWVSIAMHRSKYRATYRVYRPLFNNQKKLHGDSIAPSSRTSKSDFTSIYEAIHSAEEFLVKNKRGQELAEKCRDMINEEYRGKSISLKTLWFLYYPSIMKQKKCKSIPLESIFLQENSLDDPICTFPVCKEMDLELWGELFNRLCDECEARREDVNHIRLDFYYLFEYAILNLHCIHNPLWDWFCDVKKTSRAVNNTRKRLGTHSIFPEKERVLLDYLNADLANIDLAEALYFKYYTGISWRELLALTWKNILVIENMANPKADEKTFHKCMPLETNPELVKVRVQKYYDPKTDAVELLFPPYKMRDIPLTTGVVNRLRERFGRIKPGIDNPLFTETDGGEGSYTGLSISSVKEYAKEVFSTLGIPPRDIDVFDESGEPVPTDLNNYHGDIYQSTFRRRIVEEAMIEDDNCAYLCGCVRKTTAGRNYLEYVSGLPQHSMQVALERWYAKSLSPRRSVSRQIIPLDDVVNSTIVGSAGPTRQKIRIRIKIDSVDEANLTSETFGINIKARYGFDVEAVDETGV